MLSMRFRSQILPLIGRISSTSSLLIRSKIPFLRNFEHSQPKRSYHLTAICQKKAAGKDKDKGKSKGDDEPAVELPEVSTYSKPMDNSVKWFTSELDKIKVGRVNLEIFTELPVETYGTVGKAGQVSLISPTKLRIALFDSAIADAVVQALKNCGMGLNPQVEGGVNITAFIPKPSQESRDLMLKTAAKTAEKVRSLSILIKGGLTCLLQL